jgi:serine/threonine protein phosphatase 1
MTGGTSPAPPSAGSADTLAPQKFARLRGAKRVWAVSSIHGEADRLVGLHDLLGRAWQAGDRLVYLGNYLGRGPQIRRTIDEVLRFRLAVLSQPNAFACDVAFLRGSQEEMWQKLLQLQFASNPGEVLAWMVRAGVEATVRDYGGELRQGFAATRDGPRAITRWTSALRSAMNSAPGHTSLFATLHHAAITEDERLLFVHAGIDPYRPISGQGDAFWWAKADILELTEPFDGFHRVVRGFDRDRRGLVEREFGVSLDAGAGRGGRLLAAAFGLDGSVLEVLDA